MRCLSAGFSHGSGYVAIIEGLPAGLEIDGNLINAELGKRQSGYGRSQRMQTERDATEIMSGLIDGRTVGAPVAICVRNLMHDRKSFSVPRPGHADFAGALKYGLSDMSEVAEAASGRATVMTVALGAVCKQLLSKLGINISGSVLNVGGQTNPEKFAELIDKARQNRDTVGASGEVVIKGVLAGFGSYVQSDRRFDGKLAGAVMSIPGVKSVEFGLGKDYQSAFGSASLDEISEKRTTNYAGGIEGGMTNGEDIVFRFSIKPPPTVPKGIASMDLSNSLPATPPPLRSDTCIAESVTTVAECVAAYELCGEILRSLGSDTMDELIERYKAKANLIRSRLKG